MPSSHRIIQKEVGWQLFIQFLQFSSNLGCIHFECPASSPGCMDTAKVASTPIIQLLHVVVVVK